MVALPLVHTAGLTAAVFGAANTLLLRVRIAVEEGALGDRRVEEARRGRG